MVNIVKDENGSCYAETYLQNKLLINVALRNAGLEVWILKKAQQKLVDKLENERKQTHNEETEGVIKRSTKRLQYQILTCM